MRRFLSSGTTEPDGGFARRLAAQDDRKDDMEMTIAAVLLSGFRS